MCAINCFSFVEYCAISVWCLDEKMKGGMKARRYVLWIVVVHATVLGAAKYAEMVFFVK